jgi:hypothetical protein
MNFAQSDEVQRKATRILNKKYEYHSKIYTHGSKKEENVRHSVVLNESTIRIKQLPQKSIYSADQSAIINAIYSPKNTTRKE